MMVAMVPAGVARTLGIEQCSFMQSIVYYFGACVALGFCRFRLWDDYSIPMNVLILYEKPHWEAVIDSAVFLYFITHYLRPLSPTGWPGSFQCPYQLDGPAVTAS